MASAKIKELPTNWHFPSTRYRGSKRKILPWIWSNVADFQFNSVLDLFGGTGIVSVLFKRMGKKVTYNDYLHFNYLSGLALVENSNVRLIDEDIDFILTSKIETGKLEFISKTFENYYFLASENTWLDHTIQNIQKLEDIYSGNTLLYKQALGYWALGQACLIKRPFNLFHRKNLSLRTNNVERKFGNKTTWETPFPNAFLKFVNEANQVIFDNEESNISHNIDALSFPQTDFDLVYLDPPYFFENQRDVDYCDLYHFLDGITQYNKWGEMIDYSSFNLRFKNSYMKWPAKSLTELTAIYTRIINKFSNSIIVISHKSGSLVPVGMIKKILIANGKKVTMRRKKYNYALSKQNGKPRKNVEWLIIGN